MPNMRKKAAKRATAKKTEPRNNFVGAPDVTIDDFANASRIRTRLKKAAVNVCIEEKHEVTIEKELEYEEETSEECNVKLRQMEKGKKNTFKNVEKQRRNRKTQQDESTIESEGIDYPLDLWFIISEYISPDAVGKFARICRSSYHVTTTGKFWFHMYKSYYRYVPGLPERLQPQCMVRLHGLRACVIRMLHYTYFALKRSLSDFYLRQEGPHSLVKRRCCLMWHKAEKTRWYFFFKLKVVPNVHSTSLTNKNKSKCKKTDFLEMLEDVAVNPEEDCKVLRVISLKYSMLPPVIGLTLQTVSVNLMPGFKDHRLQLGFGTSNVPSTLTNHVILNDVVDYQILDWWHPCYPHQDAIYTIELPASDSWD